MKGTTHICIAYGVKESMVMDIQNSSDASCL